MENTPPPCFSDWITQLIDGFVKSPTSVRHAHGPEQSRWAALRCIPCPVKLKAAIS